MENNQENGFCYTYSTEEQEQIKKIRARYTEAPVAEDKMARLTKLDKSAARRAECAALITGIVGTLVLGTGMSLFMSDLGALLQMNTVLQAAVGITLGILGGVAVALAYPIYNAVLKAERKRIAPEILRLTDELLK